MSAGRVRIQILEDGRKAVMTLLHREVTIEEVKSELHRNNISSFIKWEEMEFALEDAKKDKAVQKTVIAAVPAESSRLKICGEEILTERELVELKSDLLLNSKAIHAVRAGEKYSHTLRNGIYVLKNEVFFTQQTFHPEVDIFDKPIRYTAKIKPQFGYNDTVTVQNSNGIFEYRAKTAGYVTLADNATFVIEKPTFIDTEAMNMFFIVAPVLYGGDEMERDLRRTAWETNLDTMNPGKSVESILSETRSPEGNISCLSVRNGRMPISGSDAKLEIMVEHEKSIHPDSSEKINYKEINTFVEVEKGALIAKKTVAIPGIPGEDVNGRTIETAKVKDVEFNPGENVITTENGDEILYYADITGILDLHKTRVSVLDVLHIRGDVSQETGNIRTSKGIIIDGTITAGFVVRSANNITIKGSIENGAVVKCGGDLNVYEGIFGENTDVVVRGSAVVGFIQNSKLHVDKNLTVKKFIYLSDVYCGEVLSVEGRRCGRCSTCSVLGGKITAMKSVFFASVGSNNERTCVFCGTNPDVIAMMKDLRSTINSYSKRVIRLKNSLHLDVDASDAHDKLRKLTGPDKDRVKKVLVELKEMSAQYRMHENKLNELAKQAYADDISECVIKVKGQVVPDVILNVGNKRKVIDEEVTGLVFTY